MVVTSCISSYWLSSAESRCIWLPNRIKNLGLFGNSDSKALSIFLYFCIFSHTSLDCFSQVKKVKYIYTTVVAFPSKFANAAFSCIIHSGNWNKAPGSFLLLINVYFFFNWSELALKQGVDLEENQLAISLLIFFK